MPTCFCFAYSQTLASKKVARSAMPDVLARFFTGFEFASMEY